MSCAELFEADEFETESVELATTGVYPIAGQLGYVIADERRDIVAWEQNVEDATDLFRTIVGARTITRCSDYALVGYQRPKHLHGVPGGEAYALTLQPSREDVDAFGASARAALRSNIETLPPPPADDEESEPDVHEADTLRQIQAAIAWQASEWEREDAVHVCTESSMRLPCAEQADCEKSQ